MCFVFSDLKCYLSAISGSRNHLWSAKEKEWWKNNKEKKSFSTYKKCFFFFLFEPLLLSNLITFLFLIHFWQFKDEHTRDLLGVLGTDFDSVQWFGCLSSWPSLLCEAVIFSFHICFWQLLVCQMCQEEGSSFVWTSKTIEPSPWIQPALNA
jgi:hypothetical protein